jgi:hypothetical protein
MSKFWMLYPVMMSGSATLMNSAHCSRSFSSVLQDSTSLPTIWPHVLRAKTFLMNGSDSPYKTGNQYCIAPEASSKG